jgi:hypothetical protein
VAAIAAAVGYVVWSGSRSVAAGESMIANIGDRLRDTIRYPEDWPPHAFPRGTARISLVEQANGEWRACDLSAQDPVLVVLDEQRTPWGVWHHIGETWLVDLKFQHCREVLSPLQDSTECLRILKELNRVNSERMPIGVVDAYSKGEVSYCRILWLGVLGDLSILAAFAAIIFSFMKLRREIRWRKPGHCAKCDYDLAGLTTNQCPECGAAVNPSKSI